MDTFQFEMEAVPVRTLALPELLECYLRSRNNDPLRNPLDKRDENNTKKAFALLAECFPLADTSQIDGEALEKFQLFLVQQTGRGGKPFSRNYCNTLLKFAKSVFFWAMALKPPIITEGRAFSLSKVKALKPSPKIRENKRRKPVPASTVEAFLPHCRREVIADMVQLQEIHAMRSIEVCNIKPSLIDFDFDDENWLYQPEEHKTAGRGIERCFVLCKASQEIIKKHMTDDPEQVIFRNRYGKPFTTGVYDNAVRKIIEKYGLKKFTPYQLRHTTATEIKKKYGMDHARALLGHTTENMTRRYVHDEIEMIQQIANGRNKALAKETADGNKTAADSSATDSLPPPTILRLYTGERGEV